MMLQGKIPFSDGGWVGHSPPNCTMQSSVLLLWDRGGGLHHEINTRILPLCDCTRPAHDIFDIDKKYSIILSNMAQLVVWGPSWGVASVDPESLSVLVRSRTTCSTPRSAASSNLHTSLHIQPHFPRFIIFLTSTPYELGEGRDWL